MYSIPLIRGVCQATAPMSTTFLGRIIPSCLCRKGAHASTSSARGFLLLGVLCLTMFVTKTVCRSMQFWARTLLRNFPALPTKGLPDLSSSVPGFCPTSTSFASCGPSPETAFKVAFQSRHFLQIRICSSRSFKVNGITCD